nr:reverse transcriptase domain-containing protein [Tanacetum cinerariifolium]
MNKLRGCEVYVSCSSRVGFMVLAGKCEEDVQSTVCEFRHIPGPFPSSRRNKYILVVVDYLLKWVEAKALPTDDAQVVCKFLKNLFVGFETTRAIISDRGTYFCNDQFAKVMLKFGVTHRLATSQGKHHSTLVRPPPISTIFAPPPFHPWLPLHRSHLLTIVATSPRHCHPRHNTTSTTPSTLPSFSRHHSDHHHLTTIILVSTLSPPKPPHGKGCVRLRLQHLRWCGGCGVATRMAVAWWSSYSGGEMAAVERQPWMKGWWCEDGGDGGRTCVGGVVFASAAENLAGSE